MMKALIAKFTQHPDLYAVLMSTGDAEIVEHTERDRYWGDGEDGTGKAMLGKLLVQLRNSLRSGFLPGSDFPINAEWAMLLSKTASDLATEVAKSNLPDYEKLFVLRLISAAESMFAIGKGSPAWENDWAKFINERFTGDFQKKLAHLAVTTGRSVDVTQIDKLNISHDEKMLLYRKVAKSYSGQGVQAFVGSLNQLGLTSEEIEELYLLSLEVEYAASYALDSLPTEIVTDAFIQKIMATLNSSKFRSRFHHTNEEADQRFGESIQQIVDVAANLGLKYLAQLNNQEFDTKSKIDAHTYMYGSDPMVFSLVLSE